MAGMAYRGVLARRRSRAFCFPSLPPAGAVILRWVSMTVPVAVVACGALALTLRPLHIDAVSTLASVETAVALLSVAAAVLLLSCFRKSHRVPDLALLTACVTLSVTGVVFSALPGLAGGAMAQPDRTARMVCDLIVAAALMAMALSRPRSLSRPRLVAGATLGVAVGLVVLAAGFQQLVGFRWAPNPVGVGLAPAVGHPVALCAHLLVAAVLVVAAIAFRRDGGSREQERSLLAVACVLLAGTALQYLTVPAPGADWITAATVMRLLASLVILLAALARYSASRREAAARALELERERLMRDVHDGLAQDLAFIVAYTQQRSLSLGPDHPLSIAARRALAASRGALDDLAVPAAQSTGAVLGQLAETLSARFGVDIRVRIECDPDEQRPSVPEFREHIVRIGREAIVNAVRHGAARRVEVVLERKLGALRLRVIDDGCGIAPELARAGSGTGLATMRARAAALAGELSVHARPEGGTEVEVLMPVDDDHDRQPQVPGVRRVGRGATILTAALIAAATVTSVQPEARQGKVRRPSAGVRPAGSATQHRRPMHRI